MHLNYPHTGKPAHVKIAWQWIYCALNVSPKPYKGTNACDIFVCLRSKAQYGTRRQCYTCYDVCLIQIDVLYTHVMCVRANISMGKINQAVVLIVWERLKHY